MSWKDGKMRCRWANPDNEIYVRYHDEEWGVPVHDDRKLFEMLVLEGFQAGLSWECVLNKREAFRKAFDGFDLEKVCGYDEEKMEAFDRNFDEAAGPKASLLVSNVANTRKFEIKTPTVTIQADPDYADLVETKIVDGRRCLVIGIDENVLVNGIAVAATEMGKETPTPEK